MIRAQDLIREKFTAFEQSEPISHLIGKLLTTEEHTACILDNGVFAGIFAYEKLLTSRIDIAQAKLVHFVHKVPHLQANNTLPEIAQLMFESNALMLPVTEGTELLGTVSVFDVLSHLTDLPELQPLKIKDIRHPQAITIQEDEKLNNALEIMHDNHIDRLPVMDNQQALAGFLSHLDILKKYYSHHINRDVHGRRKDAKALIAEGERPNILALPVADFMNRGDIIKVGQEELLQTAVQTMLAHKVLSLIVEQPHGKIGIITKRDLLEAIMNTRVQKTFNIHYVGLDTLSIEETKRQLVYHIASSHAEKIKELLGQLQFTLIVHIKEYEKEGKSHKYSIHLRLEFPGTFLISDKEQDWILENALHNAFTNIERQVDAHQKRTGTKEHITPRSEAAERMHPEK